MSACDVLVENASLGVAPALRAVDCLAGETTALAFGRVFGSQGGLMPALLIVLTLYIAFFAISLMLGRSRLSISALTPRMLTLGLVLTFAGKVPGLGRLPGDIVVRRGNFTFYFPLVTSLILSILLSVVLALFRR